MWALNANLGARVRQWEPPIGDPSPKFVIQQIVMTKQYHDSREPSSVHTKVSPARPGAHSPARLGEIGQGRASTSLFRDVHVHQRINTLPPILIASNMGLPDSFSTDEETFKHAMGVVKTPVLGHVSMSGVFEKENTTSLSGMSAISVPLPHELDYGMNTHGVTWSSPRMPAPEA